MRKINVRGCSVSGTNGVASVPGLDSIGTTAGSLVCGNAFERLQNWVRAGRQD